MIARTDRVLKIRGLYGIADADTAPDGDPVGVGAAMLQGGCRLIQLRCKGWSLADTRHAALELAMRCREHGALFIVNDHPHIAVEAEAAGVHVGQTDADPATVRGIVGPDRIVGRSTNDLGAVVGAAEHADYVAFGPVFTTQHLSRPKLVQGVEALRRARDLVAPSCPLVAIGGIDAHRLHQVRATGVDAWAVIGAIASAADPIAATRALL